MNEWELSKENIQPLINGRQMLSLQAALTPKADDIVQKQSEYEQRLRQYAGDDDIMELWHEYILWAEQNFPHGGKHGNIDKLIAQCVQYFIEDIKYYNDERYVSVWLKFGKQSANSLEIFNKMESIGVGQKSARFYCEFAWHLDQLGDSKRALALLSQAINQGAQPMDKLAVLHKSIVAKLAHEMSSAEIEASTRSSSIFPEVLENRQVFSGLQPIGKKHLAPTNRLAFRTDPLPTTTKVLKSSNNANGTSKFKIFTEPDDNELKMNPADKNSTKRQIIQGHKFISVKDQFKENEQIPGKWQNGKIIPPDQKVVPIPVGGALTKHAPFSIHSDEIGSITKTPMKLPGTSSVLGVQSASVKAPSSTSAYPPSPNKMPMYNRKLVYGGAKEMSFEEIRAAAWIAKKKQIELAAKERSERENHQLMLKCKMLEEENQILLASSSSSRSPSLKNTPESQCSSISSHHRKFEDSSASQHSSLYSDSSHSLHVGAMNKKPSPNKSVTRDVFNLWNTTICTGNQKVAIEPKPFVIYEDSNVSQNSKEVYIDEERNSAVPVDHKCETTCKPKQGFEIYQDEIPTSAQVTLNKKKEIFSIYEDPKPVSKTIPDKIFEAYSLPQDENSSNDSFKENISPELAQSEITKPKLRCQTGILVPSTTVPFVPLEDQNIEDDSDEELAYPLGDTKNDNYTIINEEPIINSKLFSTPFAYGQQLPVQSFPFCVDDGLTIAIDYAKPINEDQPEFTHPESKTTKKTVIMENKPMVNNRMSLGVGLSPIMEGSREASKSSSSSSGYTTSHTCTTRNSSVFGPKSLTKNSNYKLSATSNPSISEIESKNLQFEEYLACKPKISGNDVFSTVALQECLRLCAPLGNVPGYYSFSRVLPHVTTSSTVKFGDNMFEVLSLEGKGSFASVFKAIDKQDKEVVALKVNKKPNEWEFFITNELKKRLMELQSPIDSYSGLLHYHKGYFFKNGSVLISEYSKFGSLLDLVNILKTKGQASESLALYFTWELLQILQNVHNCNIIHADIKPDNILLMNIPDASCLTFKKVSCLRLIDFGQAIDLTMYKEGTTFDKRVTTSGFQCPEMMENRPWTFQQDLYGLLACSHIMLFSQYMEITKNQSTNLWESKSKIKRYWKIDFWKNFFSTFLNIPSCDQIPPLEPFIKQIEGFLSHSIYKAQINTISNQLKLILNKKL